MVVDVAQRERNNIKFYVSTFRYELWGPIDPKCSNCIGKGWAQYLVSYVQTA